jgi:5-methylcytosine-specific restriction endonuclease McrA
MDKTGIIRINGLLYKLTPEGRFRRHWKNAIRSKDARIHGGENLCVGCGVFKKITVDHHPPLRESVDNPKIILLCWECHSRKNSLESKLFKPANYVQNCSKGHNTYLRPDLTIYCRVCRKVLNKLIHIKDNEYEVK